MAYKEHTLNDNVLVQMHIVHRNYVNSRIETSAQNNDHKETNELVTNLVILT